MKTFSVAEAAFSGFRLIKQRPGMFATWVAISLVFTAISTVVSISAFGNTLSQFQSAAKLSPPEALANFARIAPFIPVVLIVALIVYSVIIAAINRSIIKPEENSFAYIRFGADEFRQMGLIFLIIAVAIGGYLAFLIGLFVFGIMSAVILGLLKASMGPAAPFVSGAFMVVLFLALIAAIIFIEVRLSLANSLTFASKRINLFGSWDISHRNFWRMFGTYFIVIAVIIALQLLVLAITAALTGGVAGMFNPQSALKQADFSSISAYLTPPRIALLVISAVLSNVIRIVTYAPAATIYQALTAQSGAGDRVALEEVFS